MNENGNETYVMLYDTMMPRNLNEEVLCGDAGKERSVNPRSEDARIREASANNVSRIN